MAKSQMRVEETVPKVSLLAFEGLTDTAALKNKGPNPDSRFVKSLVTNSDDEGLHTSCESSSTASANNEAIDLGKGSKNQSNDIGIDDDVRSTAETSGIFSSSKSKGNSIDLESTEKLLESTAKFLKSYKASSSASSYDSTLSHTNYETPLQSKKFTSRFLNSSRSTALNPDSKYASNNKYDRSSAKYETKTFNANRYNQGCNQLRELDQDNNYDNKYLDEGNRRYTTKTSVGSNNTAYSNLDDVLSVTTEMSSLNVAGESGAPDNSLSISKNLAGTAQSQDDVDELKRSYERKIREKDSLISDLRDEFRRESVKLKQRHEHEKIEMTNYSEEQKRLYSEAMNQAKEYKRDLQDKKWNLEMIQSDINSNKDQCSLLQRRIDNFQKELNSAIEEKEKVAKQKKIVENSLYEAESEINELKTARSALQSTQTALKMEFLSVQEEIANREETINELNTKLIGFKSDNSKMYQETESLKVEIEEKDRVLSNLKRDKETRESRIRELEMTSHELGVQRKKMTEMENRFRDVEDEYYNKESKYREKLEELEYELQCAQDSVRKLNDTAVIENTELKRKNMALDEKIEEYKKKIFQADLKMQEMDAQIKTSVRNYRKLEDKFENIEMAYQNAVKNRQRRPMNYDQQQAAYDYHNPTLGMGASGFNGTQQNRYTLDDYQQMLRITPNYSRDNNVYNPETSYYGADSLNNANRRFLSTSNIGNNNSYNPYNSTNYNNGVFDLTPEREYYYDDQQYQYEKLRAQQRSVASRGQAEDHVDTFTDEFGFERPIFSPIARNRDMRRGYGGNPKPIIETPPCDAPLNDTRSHLNLYNRDLSSPSKDIADITKASSSIMLGNDDCKAEKSISSGLGLVIQEEESILTISSNGDGI